MFKVKSVPIYKNKKLYGVGDLFPYSDKDKHLLWNLEKIEETEQITVSETTVNTVVSEETAKAPKIVSKSKRKKTNS